VGGFVRRHQGWDDEGAFLPCTFWLAECLAHQGRLTEARTYFDRAAGTANDVGLFAEEFDHETGEPLGNFPQALTHLSHLTAAVALRDTGA
jgi:GH15 family glucan-1,4-alpha-glucosidase